MPNPNRHKGNYKVGDEVVAINAGVLTGLQGRVLARVGFFSTRYIVSFGGKRSKPIKGKYLALKKH